MYMLQLYTGKHDDIRAAPRFDNAVETGCKSAIKSELIFESVLGAGLYQFSRRLIQTSDQYPQQLRYNLQENVETLLLPLSGQREFVSHPGTPWPPKLWTKHFSEAEKS